MKEDRNGSELKIAYFPTIIRRPARAYKNVHVIYHLILNHAGLNKIKTPSEKSNLLPKQPIKTQDGSGLKIIYFQ